MVLFSVRGGTESGDGWWAKWLKTSEAWEGRRLVQEKVPSLFLRGPWAAEA